MPQQFNKTFSKIVAAKLVHVWLICLKEIQSKIMFKRFFRNYCNQTEDECTLASCGQITGPNQLIFMPMR